MNPIKLIGSLLLLMALLVIIGMIVDSLTLWFVIDLLIIGVCGVSGFILLNYKT